MLEILEVLRHFNLFGDILVLLELSGYFVHIGAFKDFDLSTGLGLF